MKVPKQTAEIFELLSKRQFICSNSSDIHISKLYEIIDDLDNFDALYDYFNAINFILEKGDEYYYFSRKNESRADLERKLEIACRWIDILDFLKTFDNNFASGYNFTPMQVATEVSVQAVLKNKADSLKNVLKLDEKTPYLEVVNRIIKSLCDDGFVEEENEILKSYKVLSSFKFLEELVNNINIPEEIQHEIPE
ncbi:condensin complex protein MksE [Dysgonomonas macrotermitis]|uniref:Uncharacterized protein n=1 Tax=Dysgonomonas macrotermitis TaxID=1346286 RepID=A0A1M5ILB0_9BACT|nr:hypothetical protein [Dysgonomonas macrotermitis]SHG28710.1 hypothetical protein SAMN05444362_12019 [Dysgonomonas macrotermitis]